MSIRCIKHAAKINMVAARRDLSRIIRHVSSTGERVIISHRNAADVVLIPADQDVIGMKDFPQQLACLLSWRFMPLAPKHIIVPQIEELANLPISALCALGGVEFPLEGEERQVLVGMIGDAGILERLENRVKIAREIAEAEVLGLYELSEHNTAKDDF